jgi:hypothetical protein
MKTTSVVITIFVAVALIGGAIGWYAHQQPEQNQGSVTQGNDYYATTTPLTTVFNPQVIKGSGGSLGSVVITITGTAPLDLYDATTTNVNLRTGQVATTSLPLLAHFGGSPTVGNYVFDESFYKGLIAVYGTGTISTTTITYR